MVYHEVVPAGEAVRGIYEHCSASGVDELEVGQIQVDLFVMADRLPQCVFPDIVAAQIDASSGAQAREPGAAVIGELQRTVELVPIVRGR
ncbi:hypothetical protein GCM10029992_55700 [Glycomyces albus]